MPGRTLSVSKKVSDGSDSESDAETEVGHSDSNLSDASNISLEDATKTDMPPKGIMSRRMRVAYYGFCAQYFAVGIIYGGIPATIYPVFLGYLNVPAYVYATVGVISSLPWSFKFFFGLINDTVPVFGYRRKPYMCLGWTMCAAVLIALGTMELPPPYWCVDPKTGGYLKEIVLPSGKKGVAEPCHPESSKLGGQYAMMLMLAALGYVIADVAADGLTTELAKAEPISRRGKTQTTAYMVRSGGALMSTLFVGTCMNSKLYNGSSSWGLTFEQICTCFALPAAIMVPVSAFMVHEPRKIAKDGHLETKEEEVESCGSYFKMCWELLKSKAMFYAILYVFLTPVISGIRTTAGDQVTMNWAKVDNFQKQMFSVVGSMLEMFGLWLVKKYFLDMSWRKMLFVTAVFMQVVDWIFTTLTVFDWVRSPYLCLGEAVLTEIPTAANFVVSTFIIVEMADDGNEGLVYGLMTTAGNLGNPFARALGNQLFELFHPSLGDTKNYIEDTNEFRWTVYNSYLLSYFFSFASLLMLFFLPNQKADAQRRKKTYSRRPIFGYVTITMLVFALCYSLTINFLSMNPKYMCLKLVGGDGCDVVEVVVGNATLATPTL